LVFALLAGSFWTAISSAFATHHTTDKSLLYKLIYEGEDSPEGYPTDYLAIILI